MKQLITWILLMTISILSKAQLDTAKKTPLKTAASNTLVEKTIKSNRAPIAKIPDAIALPDLKFTAFNVTAVPAGGAPNTYNLTISYTIKNAGIGPVLEDNVTIAGFLTNEDLLPKTKDLSFTNDYWPGGGEILSDVKGSGETLAPGASKQRTFHAFNIQLSAKPKPVYFLIINPFGGPKESNTDNNRVEMTLLL